jgi:hypothetical protein
MYYIGILPELGDEFERREVWERSGYEQTKFNCIYKFSVALEGYLVSLSSL